MSRSLELLKQFRLGLCLDGGGLLHPALPTEILESAYYTPSPPDVNIAGRPLIHQFPVNTRPKAQSFGLWNQSAYAKKATADTPSPSTGILVAAPPDCVRRSPKGEGWCRLSDSNQRPTVYKTVALPAELKRHRGYPVILRDGKADKGFRKKRGRLNGRETDRRPCLFWFRVSIMSGCWRWSAARPGPRPIRSAP